MSKHHMTSMATAVVFAGFMQTLAAQQDVDVTPTDNTSQQIVSENKPLTENPTPVTPTQTQAFAQPYANLLSEMKVYPSF